MLGSTGYPVPASTKSPMETPCSQLRVVPGPRWIPAFDGHHTPLDTPIDNLTNAGCIFVIRKPEIKTVTAGGRGSPPLHGGLNSGGSLRSEQPDCK